MTDPVAVNVIPDQVIDCEPDEGVAPDTAGKAIKVPVKEDTVNGLVIVDSLVNVGELVGVGVGVGDAQVCVWHSQPQSAQGN